MFAEAKKQASVIAQTVDKTKYGFDITILITLLSALLPMIIKCFAPDNPQQARDYVSRRYRTNRLSNGDGGYSSDLIKRMMNNAKQAAVKEGVTLNNAGAKEVAIKTLDHIRTGGDAAQQLVISETNEAIRTGKMNF